MTTLSASPARPGAAQPGSGFAVRGGQLIDPNGQPFVAVGINNRPTDSTNAAAILAMFPGLTFVRLAMSTFVDPADWNGFVSTMEAAHVVCEAEYHPWPMQNALSGAALTAEANWASAWATYYKNRPYVWVGSMNEPQGGDMTPEHVAVYNAVRAADPTKMVMLVAGIGGGNPGATGAAELAPAAYAKMTNIVWDLHYYGWTTYYSGDLAACAAKLLGSVASGTGIAACQGITSGDGIVPVIVGEFGPSTSGAQMDANAPAVLAAVFGAVTKGLAQGHAGWSWNADPFNALQASGRLTAWGKQLAAAIVAIKGGALTPPVTQPVAPPVSPLIQLRSDVNALGVSLASVIARLTAAGG